MNRRDILKLGLLAPVFPILGMEKVLTINETRCYLDIVYKPTEMSGINEIYYGSIKEILKQIKSDFYGVEDLTDLNKLRISTVTYRNKKDWENAQEKGFIRDYYLLTFLNYQQYLNALLINCSTILHKQIHEVQLNNRHWDEVLKNHIKENPELYC